jgi:hypothetical protein
MEKLYVELARTIQARENCLNSDHSTNPELTREWTRKHSERLGELVREHMPSGAGVDDGTSLNLGKSNGEKLVFETSFHHMNAQGVYDGWTEHTVVVTASLMFGINLRITGRNRNDIKDYLHQVFWESLMKEV